MSDHNLSHFVSYLHMNAPNASSSSALPAPLDTSSTPSSIQLLSSTTAFHNHLLPICATNNSLNLSPVMNHHISLSLNHNARLLHSNSNTNLHHNAMPSRVPSTSSLSSFLETSAPFTDQVSLATPPSANAIQHIHHFSPPLHHLHNHHAGFNVRIDSANFPELTLASDRNSLSSALACTAPSTSLSSHAKIVPGAVVNDELVASQQDQQYSNFVGSLIDSSQQPVPSPRNAPVVTPSFSNDTPDSPSDLSTLPTPKSSQPLASPMRAGCLPNPHIIARLEELEHIIDLSSLAAPPHLTDYDEHRRSFKTTVNAVCEIVTDKLYKWRGMSLEDYFRTRFSISRAQVYRVVDSAGVLRDLKDLEDSWDFASVVGNAEPGATEMPLPVKQRVCAAIKAATTNKQFRQELWKALCRRCPPHLISSKDVKETWAVLLHSGIINLENNQVNEAVVESMLNDSHLLSKSAISPESQSQTPSTDPIDSLMDAADVPVTPNNIVICNPSPEQESTPRSSCCPEQQDPLLACAQSNGTPKKGAGKQNMRMKRRINKDMKPLPNLVQPAPGIESASPKRPRLRRAASSVTPRPSSAVYSDSPAPPKRRKRSQSAVSKAISSANKQLLPASTAPQSAPVNGTDVSEGIDEAAPDPNPFGADTPAPSQSSDTVLASGTSPYPHTYQQARTSCSTSDQSIHPMSHPLHSRPGSPNGPGEESPIIMTPVVEGLAHIAGGAVNPIQAKLIDSTIQSLQQLMDSGIFLEPMVAGCWVPGVTQYRFRKDTPNRTQTASNSILLNKQAEMDNVGQLQPFPNQCVAPAAGAVTPDMFNNGVLASRLLDLANHQTMVSHIPGPNPSGMPKSVANAVLTPNPIVSKPGFSTVPLYPPYSSSPLMNAFNALPPPQAHQSVARAAMMTSADYGPLHNNDPLDLLAEASVNSGFTANTHANTDFSSYAPPSLSNGMGLGSSELMLGILPSSAVPGPAYNSSRTAAGFFPMSNYRVDAASTTDLQLHHGSNVANVVSVAAMDSLDILAYTTYPSSLPNPFPDGNIQLPITVDSTPAGSPLIITGNVGRMNEVRCPLRAAM